MFHYYFVFHTEAWQTIWHCCSSADDSRAHPSGRECCITTADQDLSLTAGLDKSFLCGVVQMVLLFIYFINRVLKEQYENCCWQGEHQLLLDTVLVYDVVKGTAWYYVCVELRKETDDSCCVCSDCSPLRLEVTNWTLADAAKPYIHRFFPHIASVPALMTFLQVTFTYWKCLICNIFHECTLWSSWQPTTLYIQEVSSVP